jgi:hypothetical protein
MASLIQKYQEQSRSRGLRSKFSKAAIKWFKDNVSKNANIKNNQKQIFKESALIKTAKIRPGKMYLYRYDPKLKKELPYYDTLPLIIAVDVTDTGWQGLNLHYLPPELRARLMSSLMGIANNKKFDDTTKLKLSYKLLQGARRYRLFEPCFKQYLTGHVKTRVYEVPPAAWEIVTWLPFDDFKGASRNKIWKDSRKQLGL